MNELTVLIVDDDKTIVQALKESISLLTGNYNVKTAYEAKNALEIIEKQEIDLMILDIHMPDISGLQFLAELQGKGIWLPTIILSGTKINENSKEFREFGVIDFFRKPVLPEQVAVKIDDVMRHRERMDVIKNFSLPSMLQLIEMEERTGIITVTMGQGKGRIFFKQGKLMDIKIRGLSTREALKEFISSLYENKEMVIEYIDHRKEKKIDMSLMEMVMEASRIIDEKKKKAPRDEDETDDTSQDDNVSTISVLLGSLKEIEKYAITDVEGEILNTSAADFDEVVLNSSIYLWVIGDKVSSSLNLGKPGNIVYYRNAKKRLIQKFDKYIIVLDLTAITKFSAFKTKLNDLLARLILT